MKTNSGEKEANFWIGPLTTPAFVYSEHIISDRVLTFARENNDSDIRLLYSIKALYALDSVSAFVDGFSVSSLFEARLARQTAGEAGILQYTSPLLRDDEVDEIVELCDRVSLNSLSQVARFSDALANRTEVGLRINPQLSFIEDERYDPCRANSKLGVPLHRLVAELRSRPEYFTNVSGLHFHSNCDCEDLNVLIRVLRHVEVALGDDLHRFRWLNVGGGYSFDDKVGMELLRSEFQRISSTYELEIVIEPGAALVRSAGCFVSTVHDIVPGDDYPIAILDLSVNHWPEVFEYQFEPDVEGHVEGAPHTYLLAGCSCLAGDLFGVYSFEEPLEIGSRAVFKNAGAYSIVKAHMFNGINLPSIYAVRESGEVELVKRFNYDDFLARCGSVTYATSGT